MGEVALSSRCDLPSEVAVKQIPRTNIHCTSALRATGPERLVRSMAADRVWEIDTGHDLMITEPQAVADMLLRLATI